MTVEDLLQRFDDLVNAVERMAAVFEELLELEKKEQEAEEDG